MRKLYHLTALVVVFAMLAAQRAPVHAASAIAFPGAQGFGASTIGGRGGRVYEVTNTNDSGPGSLRSCVEASGPRVCIFRTGGLITVSTPLHVRSPYITIAGQTAPGGGITIRATGGSDVFSTETSQVIMRYLSIRPGPGGSDHGDAIASSGTALSNIMLDHMTYSWGVDSNFETWYRVANFTLQWSIISEALNCSTHPKGCHSKGLMLGGYAGSESKNSKGSENISVLHNLMAHDGERTPLFEICGTAQVVNNVSYNPFWTFAHQQDNCYVPSSGSPYISRINWIGNYHKRGPDSTSSTDLKVIPADDGVYSGGAQVYVRGNIGPSRPSNARPDSDWVEAGSRRFIVSTPATAPVVTITDAFTAYAAVLNGAGNSRGLDCSGNWYGRRDAIDARVVRDVKNGTGHIIDDPSQVGGWIRPAAGTPCTDGDHDGMPDAWELKYGMNPANAADGPIDTDGDGYTNLEEYLNGTSPAAQVPVETLTVASDGADDGWIIESGEATDTGGTANAISGALVLGDNATRRQYRSILSFDTAALPDKAVIQSATLKIRQLGVVGPNPFATLGNILVDIRKDSFSDNASLQPADFQAASSQNSAMMLRNSVSNGWYSASLGSRYFGAINVAGLTQFRLRFARDDNNDLVANYLRLYSGDYMLNTTYRPTLIITYYVP
jgi:hypothetical protein